MTPRTNLFWQALIGAHAAHALGAGDVRRYAPGYSPIVGFADPTHPNFDALAALCAPDELLYCTDWTGTPPDGWRVDVDAVMFRMVWAAPAPADDAFPEGFPRTRLLSPADSEQAVALAALTRPGPFGPRTLELGDYLGCFEGERLIAMAGERIQVGPLREISGVCTHPELQGRGLARRLMLRLIAHAMQRGETPILHVMRGNTAAHALYERMGFRDDAETVVRVISRASTSPLRP